MKYFFSAFAFFLFMNFSLFAQSSRVLRFSARPSNSGDLVRILWTMNAGSTCLDLVVERSENGTDFSEVYQYPSVCGNEDEAVSYSWADDAPLRYSKSFYRLKLDGAEFTLPVEIDLQSTLREKDIILYPNPSTGSFSTEFRNEKNLTYDLQVYRLDGSILYEKENCNGNIQDIYFDEIFSGVYLLKLIFTDKSSLESKLIIQ